jgi:release factor glutamine methyltransferase
VNLVEYLGRATDYLEKHGVASARLNAELMLADLLGLTRIELYTNFDRELTKGEADTYKGIVLERAGGRPLQYITGNTGFRGLTLKVAEGVFIPRPETEVLVEKALEAIDLRMGAGWPDPRVLDIGTGCGNIALSIAAERGSVTVTAIDCDEAAVRLCELNAVEADLSPRVRTELADVFPAVGGERYDVIVSNPPYIPAGMRDSVPEEVKGFEPEGALFAGAEGLDVIERIVEGAAGHLDEGGYLVLEVDESHALSVASMMEEDPWEEVAVFEDLAGRQRVVRARLGGR